MARDAGSTPLPFIAFVFGTPGAAATVQHYTGAPNAAFIAGAVVATASCAAEWYSSDSELAGFGFLVSGAVLLLAVAANFA
jgi:hypothetical protein